ncbi:MAG TPA: hypothetical protein VJ771_05665 [Candidatus Nitrosotalea sp.]|nr:hypothetical protein [Candidatus Nitrosotalea sp.]
MGGSFAAAFSRDSGIQGANSMSTMAITNEQSNNPILKFFNSPLGDILLVISSASMLLGIWFSGKMKLIPLAVSGIAIMFIGMYSYYSTSLQIAGATTMVFAHVSNYSYKVSKLLKII